MSRQIFLETFRKALYGKISENELAEHMRYYEDYLAQEIAGGRSEQEVLEELGDPRLIARTILETSGAKTSVKGDYTVSGNGEMDSRWEEHRVRRLEGWKAKAMMFAIVAVIFLLLVAVFHIMVALLPFLIVAGVIVWIIKRLQQ